MSSLYRFKGIHENLWTLSLLKERGLDQGAVSVTAAGAFDPLPGASAISCAVKESLKSVVREICTLRSVGAGGGQPPLATRSWGGKFPRATRRPYRKELETITIKLGSKKSRWPSWEEALMRKQFVISNRLTSSHARVERDLLEISIPRRQFVVNPSSDVKV